MPKTGVPIPSDVEPGQTYQAWSWGPRIRIDVTTPGSESVVVEYDVYASQAAAYGGGRPIGTYSRCLVGPAYRNFVRRNPALWAGLTAAVDAEAAGIPALAGGTIVGGPPPAWASEPAEPEE